MQKLQEAADNNDMQPIWKYQSRIRMNNTNNQAIIKKTDGAECQGMEEMLARWGEWTKEFFSKEQTELKPNISYIAEQEWGNNFTKAPHGLQHIRENSALMKITRANQE